MTDDLRKQVPDTVPDDVELFEDDDIIWGRDEHGEFRLNPMTGAAEPQEGRCGWTVKFTQERYGQKRYCTGMPESTFVDGGSDYCKRHKQAEHLMEHAHELFKHGYFATNYVNFAEKLDASKFLFAVEMVSGLFEMSSHDFDIEAETRTIEVSDDDIIDEDEVTVRLPIPTDETLSFQANELWTASLKEVMQQNMQEAVFKDGMEKKTLTESEGMEGQITDTHYEFTEHHLHLPLSRVAKDIKEHLQNGGVELDDGEGGVVTFQKNDYTLDVSPDQTDSDDAEPVSEAATDFTEELLTDEDDDGEIAVEVEE